MAKIDEIIQYDVDIIIAGRLEEFCKNMITDKKIEKMKHIHFRFLGNIGFRESIDLQMSADILLFFSNKTGIQVPGKLYEYLATDKPILCVSYNEAETEKILLKYKRAKIVYNSNLLKMSKEIKDILDEYKTHGKILNLNKEKILEYDWKNISTVLLDEIDRIGKK